jgi:hypothetical protein
MASAVHGAALAAQEVPLERLLLVSGLPAVARWLLVVLASDNLTCTRVG